MEVYGKFRRSASGCIQGQAGDIGDAKDHSRAGIFIGVGISALLRVDIQVILPGGSRGPGAGGGGAVRLYDGRDIISHTAKLIIHRTRPRMRTGSGQGNSRVGQLREV